MLVLIQDNDNAGVVLTESYRRERPGRGRRAGGQGLLPRRSRRAERR
ncbi:MAG: hypothetical protein R3A10_23035 [Caldilineaceae bacterium]